MEERLEERLEYKLNFYKVLELRLRHWVAAGRAVIVVGDLNISPQPIDSCAPGPMAQFMQRPDRAWLNSLLSAEADALGVADAFRHFHPDRQNAFTCWNTATGARINNYGSRIDHILVAGLRPDPNTGSRDGPSNNSSGGSLVKCPEPAAPADTDPVPAVSGSNRSMQSQFLGLATGCDISPEMEGSDHAPVWVDLAIPLHLFPNGHAPPAGAGSLMFPGRQASLKTWLQQQQQSKRSDNSMQQQKQPMQPGTQQQMEPQLQHYRSSQQQLSGAGQQPARAVTMLCISQPDAAVLLASSQGGRPQCALQSLKLTANDSSRQPATATAKRKYSAGNSSSGSNKKGQMSLLGFIHQGSVQQQAGSQQQGNSLGASTASWSQTVLDRAAGAPHTITCTTGMSSQQPSQAVTLCSSQQQQWWQEQQQQQQQGQHVSAQSQLVQYQQQCAGGLQQAAAGAYSQPIISQQPGPNLQGSVLQLYSARQHGHVPMQQQQGHPGGLGQPQPAISQGIGPSQQQQSQQQQRLQVHNSSLQQAHDVLDDHHKQTLAAWQRISRAMQPPVCKEHGEPCVIRTVKKRGVNNGRQFYVCARADGLPPVGRCDFFQWANDRKIKGTAAAPTGLKDYNSRNRIGF
eukprot:GHRR01024993.1.p1 GENE.GHRR01024993.1~~GHRR01024993.1.p1  ORF type:complete len:629 (+),score=275.46 GHRR01024993.1:393-2279(+)